MSTKEEEYMAADIKDFYYGTPIQECEHGQLPVELIPQEIMKKHNLNKLHRKTKCVLKYKKERHN